MSAAGEPTLKCVAVLVDITGVDRLFHYAVPDKLEGSLGVGTIVRVPLQGRRVRGWVLDDDVVPEAGQELREVIEVVSLGPAAPVVDLARFGAWRYAGRLRPLLVTASPPRIVSALHDAAPVIARSPTATAPDPSSIERIRTERAADGIAEAMQLCWSSRRAVLRLAPAASRLTCVSAALQVADERRDLLVLVPERRDAATLARRLSQLGHRVALQPEAWAEAAAGGRIVIGTRQAVLAPSPRLAGIVVIDAHAQTYTEQRSPTWNATVLAAARAESADVPCVLVSPCPTLEHLEWGHGVTLSRQAERAGWPAVEVLDRRGDDPRSGLYSERLATIVRAARLEDPRRPVVCVLNRTGRARMLACSACGAVAACERCGAALEEVAKREQADAVSLVCPACSMARPAVCAECGSMRLKRMRVGVGRVAEELAALVGEPVAEVSSSTSSDEPVPSLGILVGTEAVLHRVRTASIAVLLDLDQELLASRLRAGEQAMALLAQAARLVGARRPDELGSAERAPGRLVLQTRLADHEVVRAVVHADPSIVADAEAPRRRALRLPPVTAIAVVSGEHAPDLVKAIGALAAPVEVAPIAEDRFLVRAGDSSVLADALRAAGAPLPGVRVEVDPARV